MALSVMSIAAGAQPRSVEKAENIARLFSNQKPHARKAPQMTKVEGEEVTRLSRSRVRGQVQNADGFYVFNDEANGGYVVVSGDERQVEVLGYSPDKSFDPGNIPCGLRMLLEQYSREYDYLQTHGDGILEVTEGGEGNKWAEGTEKPSLARLYEKEGSIKRYFK